MINNGYKWSGTETMTPDQWHMVRNNPRQRDTEKRAKKAKHLLMLCEAHREVTAGQLPTGEMIKIDGHTRDFLWNQNTPTGPAELIVHVYTCNNIEAAMTLYSTVDNPAAVEGAVDQVYGALRELNVKFTSPLLKGHQFINSLRRLSIDAYGPRHGLNVNSIVKKWLPELKLLDLCNPTKIGFSSAVVSAALMTFRVHGEDAGRFWESYSNGEGELLEGYMNAVQALASRLDLLKKNGLSGGGGEHRKIIAVCLNAYESRDNGRCYKVRHLKHSSIKPSYKILTKWINMVATSSQHLT